MKIIIEPYQSAWKSRFKEEKTIIEAALALLSPVVEHIGSTSVPGLGAKPIIDILVGVQQEKQLDESVGPMISAGYTYFQKYNPLMPYRRLYVRFREAPGVKPPQLVDIGEEFTIGEQFHAVTHIHLLVKDTLHWTRHIAFRDYLRAHPAKAAEYESHKRFITRQEFKDGIAYNDAKNEWVKNVEQEALQWYAKITVN